MADPIKQAEAQAVIDYVSKADEPKLLQLGTSDGQSVQILVTRDANGVEVRGIKQHLDQYRKTPERRRGTAALGDLASFVAITKRFMDTDSAIFADPNPQGPSLTTVFDYHRAGAEASPRFGEHRARYAFPISDEWKAWNEQDKKGMNQAQFAEWIESRLADIADPAAAGAKAKEFAALLGGDFAPAGKLLELSRGLALRVGMAVKNAVNLGSGEGEMSFVVEHTTADKAGGVLKVPGSFLLAIPVFRGGAVYSLPTRLRYRVQEGRVTWFFELWRAAAAFDDAIKEACETAAKDTTLPLYVGKPEADGAPDYSLDDD